MRVVEVFKADAEEERRRIVTETLIELENSKQKGVSSERFRRHW
jgi:hypothetical protein